MNRWPIALMSILIAATAADAAIIGANEAQKHIGETATVCGPVAAARYAPELRGEPTFLQLDRAFPDEDVTVVILGVNRAKFETPESLTGRRICVSGRIQLFLGKPRMIVDTPAQLSE